jgi:hypothetical protein
MTWVLYTMPFIDHGILFKRMSDAHTRLSLGKETEPFLIHRKWRMPLMPVVTTFSDYLGDVMASHRVPHFLPTCSVAFFE